MRRHVGCEGHDGSGGETHPGLHARQGAASEGSESDPGGAEDSSDQVAEGGDGAALGAGGEAYGRGLLVHLECASIVGGSQISIKG